MERINVEGMKCSGCENRIQNAICNIEGVTSVKANHEENYVEVETDNKEVLDKVKETINNIGFKVVD